MRLDGERFWVVRASLILTGAIFLFFVTAPGILSYPLEYDQAMRIMQIILPVFIGYLGIATTYLFQGARIRTEKKLPNVRLLRLLLRGPVFLVTIALVAVVAAFWYSNRPNGPPAGGMTVDQLSWFVTGLTGILAATTGLIIAKIFPGGEIENGGK